MEGDTPDDKKNEDQLMNVKNDVSPSSLYSSSKSRNLLRKKDGGCLAAFSTGTCLKIFKNSPKVSCSDEFSTSSPNHFLRKLGANYKTDQSRKAISPSTDVSQGTIQFTMRANGMPRFVLKLDNQDVYVATLSSNNVEDQSVSYMIHLKREDSSSSSSSLLVGRLKVSTLSSCSLLSERIIERQFVLFSNNGEHSNSPCQKKNRGLSKKIVDVMKNKEQSQQPNFDHEEVKLLENDLPTNLETLAIVVKQEFPEEESGGWGLKFLKKYTSVQTESGSSLASVDVVIPSGIHGGPEDGPASLIERWKSKGNCDCGGWDLGCSLTFLKDRQPRKDNLLELYTEGSKHETTVLRIVRLRRGSYSVQFQAWLSVMQSFSIAIAYIDSQRRSDDK